MPPQQLEKARLGLFVPTATSKRKQAMWIFTRHARRTVEATICILLFSEGIEPTFLNGNEKGVIVTGRMHSARCPTPQNRKRCPTRRQHPPCLCLGTYRAPEAKLRREPGTVTDQRDGNREWRARCRTVIFPHGQICSENRYDGPDKTRVHLWATLNNSPFTTHSTIRFARRDLWDQARR